MICSHDPSLLWHCTNEGCALWQAQSADCLMGGFGKINVLLVIFFSYSMNFLYKDLHFSNNENILQDHV